MFRFTIRDVLWLTVVVAVLAAWWADRSEWHVERAGLQRSHDEVSVVKQQIGEDGWTEFITTLNNIPYPLSKLRSNPPIPLVRKSAEPNP